MRRAIIGILQVILQLLPPDLWSEGYGVLWSQADWLVSVKTLVASAGRLFLEIQSPTVRHALQGGYSDDLTVASKCAEHKLKILCPSYAVLPQW